VKKEVIQEAAEFLNQQVADCCRLIEMGKRPNSRIPIDQYLDKLRGVSDLVGCYRSYEWAFPAVHALTMAKLRGSKALWDFVFSDLKRFVSRTVAVHYDSPDEFNNEVVQFFSASGINNQRLSEDGTLGLDSVECEMMTPDAGYIVTVVENQPWIFHLAFVIDCYLLHHSLSHLASEISKVNTAD
jgi:hypothetical protein